MAIDFSAFGKRLSASKGTIAWRYPWFALEAIAEDWERAGLPVVRSADIAKCLDCPYEDCIDCISGGNGRKPGRPRNNYVLDGQISLYNIPGDFDSACRFG